jgi:hypothetical protein
MGKVIWSPTTDKDATTAFYLQVSGTVGLVGLLIGYKDRYVLIRTDKETPGVPER